MEENDNLPAYVTIPYAAFCITCLFTDSYFTIYSLSSLIIAWTILKSFLETAMSAIMFFIPLPVSLKSSVNDNLKMTHCDHRKVTHPCFSEKNP